MADGNDPIDSMRRHVDGAMRAAARATEWRVGRAYATTGRTDVTLVTRAGCPHCHASGVVFDTTMGLDAVRISARVCDCVSFIPGRTQPPQSADESP